MFFLLQGIFFGLYGALLPGPFQAYLLTQILKKGWKKTIPLAFIPLFSDLPVLLLFLLILSNLPTWVNTALQMIGGFFLLYLAWDAYQTANRTADETQPPLKTDGSFLKGVTMNLLNPNVYVFWAAIGVPTIVEGLKISTLSGLAFAVGMLGTMIPTVIGLIYLFGKIGQFSPKIHKIISLCMAVVLLGSGIIMILNGITLILRGITPLF